MATTTINKPRCALVISFLGCIPLVAGAATIELEGNLGLGRSDNVDRSAADEQSGTLTSAGLQFSVLHATRRVDADLVGDLAYLDYGSDTSGSGLNGNVSGRLGLELVEDRLRWTIQDNLGQTRRELTSAESPNNREWVNRLATGPDLRLELGGAMNLRLGARYAMVDYQHSDTDSTRAGGSLALERELSSTAVLGLNAANERIEPDDPLVSPTYNRGSAYLRYAVNGARTTFVLDGGGNRVRGGGLSESGALARLELVRQLGRRSQVTLRAGHEFTDSGNSLDEEPGDQPPAPESGTGSLVQAPLPFTNKYAELDWSASGRRTSLGLSGGWFDEDYVGGSDLDRTRLSFGFSAARNLTPRLQVSGVATYNLNTYDTAADDQDFIGRLVIAWNLGRRVSVETEGEYYRYYSDLANADARERRVWLRVRYGERFGRDRRAQQ
jgi:hypothetical protein